MARLESDREDILREATALVQRAELRVEGFAEPLVIGFRRRGEGSIYVGADPVYQFNSAGELRRGYVNGRLVKAERGQLVSLDRQRREHEVQLVRHTLSDNEVGTFLSGLQMNLATIRESLTRNNYELVGQVPDDIDVVNRIRNWLASLPTSVAVAAVPNAG